MTKEELLAKRLDKSEARKIERSLKRHVKSFQASGLLVALDLRKLQNGEAHLVRGFSSFGEYIESETEGQIGKQNAKQLSRVGQVLLDLQEAKRLDSMDTFSEAASLPIGVTGARALATVDGSRGQETMLRVFDKALELNGFVSSNSVELAVQLLLPESKDELPEIEVKISVPEAESDEEESDDGNGRRELPEWVHSIRDRLYDLDDAINLQRKDEILVILDELRKIASDESEDI